MHMQHIVPHAILFLSFVAVKIALKVFISICSITYMFNMFYILSLYFDYVNRVFFVSPRFIYL